jgi:hypothetical protein
MALFAGGLERVGLKKGIVPDERKRKPGCVSPA